MSVLCSVDRAKLVEGKERVNIALLVIGVLSLEISDLTHASQSRLYARFARPPRGLASIPREYLLMFSNARGGELWDAAAQRGGVLSRDLTTTTTTTWFFAANKGWCDFCDIL